MPFDGNKPADNQTIALGPSDIRGNLLALRDEKIVNAQKVMDLSPGNASGNIPVNNGTLCTNLNAEKLGGNLASAFAMAGHSHPVASTSSHGLMSNTDKAKLDGIAVNAEVNQNAFSNILVGTSTIQADSKTDTLEIVAGAGIALSPDVTNDRMTISVSTVSDEQIGNRTIDQTLSPAATNGNSGTIAKLFSWLANRIKAITGKTNWFDTPSKSLEQLNNEKMNRNGDTMTGNLSIDLENAGIEIGAGSKANTPFIDFHSSGSANDFDVRLSAEGGNTASGKGTLNISADELKVAGIVKVNGEKPVWHTGNFVPGNYLPLSGGTISNKLIIAKEVGSSGSYTNSQLELRASDSTGQVALGFTRPGQTAACLRHQGIGLELIDANGGLTQFKAGAIYSQGIRVPVIRYATPGDTVLYSAPTVRSTKGTVYKKFRVAWPGIYRIKFQIMGNISVYARSGDYTSETVSSSSASYTAYKMDVYVNLPNQEILVVGNVNQDYYNTRTAYLKSVDLCYGGYVEEISMTCGTLLD